MTVRVVPSPLAPNRARSLAFASSFAALLAFAPAIHAQSSAATDAREQRFLIQEFRVNGVHHVPAEEIEEAVYPFLGPERVSADVEKARAAIEALYREKGYQAAFVQVPAQDAAGGIIVIQVTEGLIGKTRVRGARYSSPAQLKQDAPSLKEGQPLNFNEVSRDLARLNQVADRRITPALKTGEEPGTIDVDIQVEETKPPLAANVELNNRNSAFTSSLRVNGGISYGNLFQRGHTVGFGYQIAPENLDDAKVFSGYYLFRPSGVENLTLQLIATKQESDVSTLGGAAVSGRGETVGARAIFALPGSESFYHTFSTGLDYKHLEQDLKTGSTVSGAPITYYTASAVYGATWISKSGSTELMLTPTLGLRGFGSDDTEFGTRRLYSSAGFITLRGELARTQNLFKGFELYLRGQAQVSGEPLVDSEQFSAGGMDTVRGYYESEAAGDDAAAATVELRSPSVLGLVGLPTWGELRFHAFVDGSVLSLQKATAGQDAYFKLLSAGFGTRLRLRKNFSASLDAGWPLLDPGQTTAGEPRVNFSLGAQY